MGHDWGQPTAEEVWNELRALVARPRRHELRAAGGSRRPPVAVLRRDASRASCSCTAGSGSDRSPGRRRRSRRSSTTRRSTSSTTSSRSGSPPAAGSTRTTPACRSGGYARRCGAARRSTSRPRTPRRSASPRASSCACRLAARRGRRAGAHRPRRCGPGSLHDAALPGRGRDERADHRRHRPEVGHGGVQGHARSASRSRVRPGGRRRAPDGPRAADAGADGPSPDARRPDRRERDAVDACSGRLGPAGMAATATSRPRRHIARGGRERARAARPAAAGAARAPVARRAGSAEGGLELRLPTPRRAAGRGLRRRHFYALFSTTPRAAAGGSTSATTSPAGSPAPRSSARRSSDRSGRPAHGPRRPRDLAAQPVPRPVRAGARPRCSRWPARRPATGAVAPIDAAGVTVARGGHRRTGGGHGPTADRLAAVRAARRPATPGLRLLRRVGVVDPASLDDYRATAATGAPPRAGDRARSGVIAEVIDVQAGRPRRRRLPDRAQVGRRSRAQPARPHYLVCNADESEPGTFKDRVLIEDDPFAIVEAMTIAGFATGCEHGYLYIRGEYPLAQRGSRSADRRRLARHGLLGATSSATGVALRHRDPARRRRLHLRRGDGALRTRSRASAASRATSRRSRSRSGCSASRPWSTTSRRWSTSWRSCSTAARRSRRSAPSGSTGPKLFCLSRPRRAAGHLRGPVRHDAARADRARRRRARRPGDPGGPARRRGRRLRRPGRSSTCRSPSRAPARPAATLGSGVVMVFDETVDLVGDRCAASPRSSATSRAGSASPAGSAPSARRSCCTAWPPAGRAARRPMSWPCSGASARRCATPRSAASARPPRSAIESRVSTARDGRPVERSTRSCSLRRRVRATAPEAPAAPERPAAVELTIDGQAVSVPDGLDDPRRLPRPGHRHPDALLPGEPHPGQRLPGLRRRSGRRARPRAGLLAQGRAGDGGPDRLRARPPFAPAGPGVPRLVRRPDSDRAPTARSLPTPNGTGRIPSDSARRPRRQRPTSATRPSRATTTPPAVTPPRRPSAQPVKIDNDLYVRDYSKCILCYKCVEACGIDAQNTFAIAVAGRGFDARISTECDVAAARFGVRLLRQLHRRLPDRRADVQDPSTTCARPERGTSRPRPPPTRSAPTAASAARCPLHVQDNDIVKVTSPMDSSVTHGHLCIKGRFGFEFVQNRGPATAPAGPPKGG